MLNAQKIAPTNATIRVNPHGYSHQPNDIRNKTIRIKVLKYFVSTNKSITFAVFK